MALDRLFDSDIESAKPMAFASRDSSFWHTDGSAPALRLYPRCDCRETDFIHAIPTFTTKDETLWRERGLAYWPGYAARRVVNF